MDTLHIADDTTAQHGEHACIRCGDCAPACPQRLQPMQLHHWLQRGEDVEALQRRLLDCSGCALCDAVCPSAIPLAQRLRDARASLLRRAALMRDAEAARARHLARNARLQREAEQRALQQAERRSQAASSDAVQAALERARARRRDRSAPDT